MGTYKIGDATIALSLAGTTTERWARDVYTGSVTLPDGRAWTFDDLSLPHGASEERAASDAVGFASYYTSDNRGDVSDWVPSAELADAISEATMWAQDDRGDYAVEVAS